MAENFNCSGCKIAKVKFAWNVQLETIANGEGEKGLLSPRFTSREIPNSHWVVLLIDVKSSFSFHVFYSYPAEPSGILHSELLKVSILIKKGENNPQKTLQYHPDECRIPKSECPQLADGSYTFYFTVLVNVKKDPVSSADPLDIAINCREGISTQLEGLFESMQFSDVNFKIGGREFPAHKLILATRSKPFADLFEHATKEKLTNHIEIEDVEPEVFQELLRFLYTGRLSVTTMDSMGVGLLIAADKYLLDDLKMECEDYFLRKLSPGKCLELILNENIPDSAENLKKEAAYFFLRFREEVMATEKWKMVKNKKIPLYCLTFRIGLSALFFRSDHPMVTIGPKPDAFSFIQIFALSSFTHFMGMNVSNFIL